MVLIQESLDISSLNELRKTVNHRIGGLECDNKSSLPRFDVNHRIGGLECLRSCQVRHVQVNHRIGGLESG